MRRAGWGVWIAYDLVGSYEEMPPNLIDELSRDRRWCQGNLMNARLMLTRGLHPAHRVGVHDRRDGVPLGAALVPVPRSCRRCSSRCTRSSRRIFHAALPALPDLAEWRPNGR
jgi:hypothetical protein